MADILDKESPVALPRQLKQILQQRIETAYYTPGRKIDSVRKISAEFPRFPPSMIANFVDFTILPVAFS